MKRFLLLTTALGLACCAAFAHGDADRAGKTSASGEEQKAWGAPGHAREVKRTVHVAMSDSMRFVPDAIEVRQGDVVRL